MARRPLVLPDSPHLEDRGGDGRMHAPSAERNLPPIIDRLRNHLPESGLVLEIASGTGQQIAALARMFPRLEWQPSDIDAPRIDSIRAWRDAAGLANLRPPIALDAAGDWSRAPDDVALVFAVNLFHLIGESDARAVITGMSGALRPGGGTFIYGPFTVGGSYRGAGDRRFDESLRTQDRRIGYKDRDWMQAELAAAGLAPVAAHDMPANNLVLVAEKSGRTGCKSDDSVAFSGSAGKLGTD